MPLRSLCDSPGVSGDRPLRGQGGGDGEEHVVEG